MPISIWTAGHPKVIDRRNDGSPDLLAPFATRTRLLIRSFTWQGGFLWFLSLGARQSIHEHTGDLYTTSYDVPGTCIQHVPHHQGQGIRNMLVSQIVQWDPEYFWVPGSVSPL